MAYKVARMKGICLDMMFHTLNIKKEVKILKKKKSCTPKRREVIEKEVNKLIDVGFISEVIYPNWLANMVFVKKTNGKWIVCIDFIDFKTRPT